MATTREPVERALTALERLTHRGGFDADGASGDGAGLLTDLPLEFFRERAAEAGLRLPERFGVGMAFLPPRRREAARFAIAAAIRAAGLEFLGWREVATQPRCLGKLAAHTAPAIFQFFVGPAAPIGNFEFRLFLARKRAETAAPEGTYICSLSERTIVYKGLLAPWQLPVFYLDLAAAGFVSRFAIFHQRYSTNTQPSWRLAQPFRFLAHNGEINTIGANRRWLQARQARLRHGFGAGDWLRVLETGVSDSASLDNALEVALRQGHPAAEALLRLTPPAWEHDQALAPEVRAWFAAAAPEQEPWDGPAALVFSDGRVAGAKLDRNGLRPLRYTRTAAGLLIVASEVGVADLDGETVAERGRLGPGEMLCVDLATGALRRPGDFSCPGALAGEPAAVAARPKARAKKAAHRPAPALAPAAPEVWRLAAAVGFTQDQYKLLFRPLIESGREAVFSMGDDAPPAALSQQHRLLWDYCKQRFAQVTNPPIDSLREAHVMSLAVYYRQGQVPSPLLDAEQWSQVTAGQAVIDCTFALGEAADPRHLFDRLEQTVAQRLAAGATAIVLSDAASGPDRCALPVLLATAAVWRAMVAHDAHDLPLWVATSQAWDTHHIAMLVATGAAGVHPYLALALAAGAATPASGAPGAAPEDADRASAPAASAPSLEGPAQFRRGVEAGLKKILAKMGISTLASYRNGQLFEIVGLDADVVDRFFPGAAAYLAGTSLRELIDAAVERHRLALTVPARAATPAAPTGAQALRDAGLYRYRHGGELHATSPDLVRRFHAFLRQPSAEKYRDYTEYLRQREPVALRDLLVLRTPEAGSPEPIANTESAEALARRFSTQAMSLGALGPEAQRALAVAMNRLGARSNTGEGGEDPEVYSRDPEANHRVKQVASARFGVTAEYLIHADELEIKMAQGSKPGEGGQLPPAKVTPYIARLRHAVPGMALISPPPHHDIYSIEDLAQLIHDLRAINPAARIGVKLVSGAGVGIIAAGVAKAGANVITISGFDGGTGASPLTSIKNTGLPWEIGLRDAHLMLERCGLRSRVRLRVDGGFKSGRDVIVAALLGADEFGFGTSALVALGCVMARQCHLNTCPAGIATQDPRFRQKFTGTPEMLIAYLQAVAQEVRESLDALGAASLDSIRGRTDLLAPRDEAAARVVAGLLDAPAQVVDPDLAAEREAQAALPPLRPFRGWQQQLLRSLEAGPAEVERDLTNRDRSVGAALSAGLSRQAPAWATAPGARDSALVAARFAGSAGQSFGAFLAAGVRFVLHGEANDYVGKCLSGGEIVITAGPEASRRGDVLAGNTILYGATAGRLFLAGRVGERFGVRNSGALAVVEGVGQHGCEYMTAGVVVNLGPSGANFGSGMTGGLAYIRRSELARFRYHPDYTRIAETLEDSEQRALRRVLALHYELTGSPLAAELLAAAEMPFVRVQPLQLPCTLADTWASVLSEAPAVAPVHERDPLTAAV